MSNHSSGPSLGKRIGEFVILGLYLAVDAIEIWHRSHLFALTLAFVGIFALLLLDGGFTKRQIGVSLATALLACILTYVIAPAIPPPEPWQGWLQPANEPTPKNGCTAASPPVPIIIVGSVGMLYRSTNSYTVVAIGQCPSLVLNRSSEGLKVSAPIYDSSGTLLGTIKENGYEISKEHSLIVEHTGDLSTLIVHDQTGAEILYVHYANMYAIKVRGRFYCPSAPQRGLIITEDAMTYMPQHNTISEACANQPRKAGICLDCEIPKK